MLGTDWVSRRVFQLVHTKNLVYNTCWEDPRLDRVALNLGPQDNILVITSGGCNTLDYVLTEPNHVFAVDMNPRQNALLELKLSGIRNLEFEDFYDMFGRGRLEDVRTIYDQKLRADLSPWSQGYWDRWIKFFDNKRRPFYFRGTAGAFARLINLYVNKIARVRPYIESMLAAETVEEQREIYDGMVRDRFWGKTMRFAMNRDTTLSMVGVPRAQRRQVESHFDGGIVQFVQDCMEAVFARLPLSDNYFWRVYMTGQYTPNCCPEYLKPDNFEKLKGGLIDRISVHTDTVENFLTKNDVQVSRFVLLDHMDWLADRFFPKLEAEWQAIVNRASSDARIIWRSGGLKTDFLDRAQIRARGQKQHVSELLQYNEELAKQLHQQDRVHTYGSFYIADLAA